MDAGRSDCKAEEVTFLQPLPFIDASPTPHHAVANIGMLLEKDGFIRLYEKVSWPRNSGGYYVVRGGSLIAWKTPVSSKTDALPFHIIAAHTDSPGLVLAPNFIKKDENGMRLRAEVYGSPILATWTDRPLGIAGKIVYRLADGSMGSKLVRIDTPIAVIPNLAIHLQREVNKEGLKLNPHDHLMPILGEYDGRDFMSLIAGEGGGVDPDLVEGCDLRLYPITQGVIAGPYRDLMISPRLDNLAMCHAAMFAMLDTIESHDQISMIALFDHEEVGSESVSGAAGPFLRSVIRRILGGDIERWERSMATSFLISADMAHGCHPNYQSLHEEGHRPVLNSGPVLKTNAGLHYATDAESGAAFRGLCHKNELKCQEFIIRPDLICGTTVGPICAKELGIATVDVGNPMLAMHSCVETAGVKDHAAMTKVFKEFLG